MKKRSSSSHKDPLVSSALEVWSSCDIMDSTKLQVDFILTVCFWRLGMYFPVETVKCVTESSRVRTPNPFDLCDCPAEPTGFPFQSPGAQDPSP